MTTAEIIAACRGMKKTRLANPVLLVGIGEVEREVADWLESIGYADDGGNYFVPNGPVDLVEGLVTGYVR